MKSPFVYALFLVLVFSSPSKGDDVLLMKRPMVLFSGVYADIESLFERAKIESTWSGFILEADTYHFFKSGKCPSPDGISIMVRTLSIEYLKTAIEAHSDNNYTTTQAFAFTFPKEDKDDGLVIILRYGNKCNKRAVAIVMDAINTLKKHSRQDAESNP